MLVGFIHAFAASAAESWALSVLRLCDICELGKWVEEVVRYATNKVIFFAAFDKMIRSHRRSVFLAICCNCQHYELT